MSSKISDSRFTRQPRWEVPVMDRGRQQVLEERTVSKLLVGMACHGYSAT